MGKYIPSAITLSIYDSEATKFGVTWQTEEAGSPILEYTTPDDTAFARATVVRAECSEGTESVKNCAVIEGIAPGKACLYRVGDESGTRSDTAVFHAPKHDPEKLTFFIVTDSQDECHWGEMLKHASDDAMKNFPKAELTVHTGDMVQEGGDAMMWREMLGRCEDFFRSIPMALIAGNHDYWYGYLHGYDSVTEKHVHIDLPPQDTRHGIYYSFDMGPAHFTMLSSGDSMETDGHGLLPEQLEWATADLAATDKKWKIVAIHNPLYSPGKYGSRDPVFGVAKALKPQLNELFVKYGVDLVLCGHDHVYAQTFPMDAVGEPIRDYTYAVSEIHGTVAKIAVDPAGPIHLESGCAGNQCRRIEEDIKPEFSRLFDEMYDMTERAAAYSAVEIDGNVLRVTYREIDFRTDKCVRQRTFGIRKTK